MIPFSHLFENIPQPTRAEIDEIIVSDCLQRFKSSDDLNPLSEDEFDILIAILFSERTSQKVSDLFDELQALLMKNAGVKFQ